MTVFTAADVGKAVLTADDVEIGHITRVRKGRAYVTPREGLVDRYGSLLAPCWRGSGRYCLSGERVREVTGEAVRLDLAAEGPSSEE